MSGAVVAVPARGEPRDGATPLPRVRGRLAPDAMFPAGLDGYRTRVEQLSSGERFRVVETGPESGPPVLLVHGWGCSVWDFNRTLAPVGEAGFRAIAVDLRGHGRSDMPADESLYATDALTGYLMEVMGLLRLTRPVVVGHSMGGALAVHLALRAPQRVQALVLVSAVGLGVATPAYVGRLLSPKWTLPIARAALRRSVLAAGLRFVYGSSVHVDERNVDEYWAPSQFPGYVPAMRALLHHFRWSLFTREELDAVHVPCLSVRGGCDLVVHAARARIAPPRDCRELFIPDAGHLPHDEAPDRVNEAIIAFLREHAVTVPAG